MRTILIEKTNNFSLRLVDGLFGEWEPFVVYDDIIIVLNKLDNSRYTFDSHLIVRWENSIEEFWDLLIARKKMDFLMKNICRIHVNKKSYVSFSFSSGSKIVMNVKKTKKELEDEIHKTQNILYKKSLIKMDFIKKSLYLIKDKNIKGVIELINNEKKFHKF